jgi:hypothetical protein
MGLPSMLLTKRLDGGCSFVGYTGNEKEQCRIIVYENGTQKRVRLAQQVQRVWMGERKSRRRAGPWTEKDKGAGCSSRERGAAAGGCRWARNPFYTDRPSPAVPLKVWRSR